MSQDLTALEAQLRNELAHCVRVSVTLLHDLGSAWSDEGEVMVRATFREPTWHDNLMLVAFATPELVALPNAGNILANMINGQLSYEMRSAAARYGWRKRRSAKALTG